MKDLIARAMEIARREAAADRRVMVVFPNKRWRCTALPRPENVYLRASTTISGLKMVSVDTLILVGREHPAWDKEGEGYARERTRTSRDPRVMIVTRQRRRIYLGYDVERQLPMAMHEGTVIVCDKSRRATEIMIGLNAVARPLPQPEITLERIDGVEVVVEVRSSWLKTVQYSDQAWNDLLSIEVIE